MPGLGRLTRPDANDQRYLMRDFLTTAPPVAVPERRLYHLGRILNQHETPQCVGYSWRQFLSSAPRLTKGGPPPEEIYALAQAHDGIPGDAYDGSTIRGGARGLDGQGYLKSYLWAFDAATAAQWLLREGTCVFGTTWYRDMSTPDAEGHVVVAGRPVGGHAYFCYGYDQPAGLFYFANSWGRRWGKDGTFTMGGEDVERLIREEGEVCTALEQKVGPFADATRAALMQQTSEGTQTPETAEDTQMTDETQAPDETQSPDQTPPTREQRERPMGPGGTPGEAPPAEDPNAPDESEPDEAVPAT